MTFPAWTTRWTSSSPCGFANLARVVVIRAGSAADAAQIAAVQRDGWFAAYEGIIPGEIIDRVTAPTTARGCGSRSGPGRGSA